MPQGSVLGPSLFVAFINDLPETVSGLCSMYGDDTKVYGEADSEGDIKKLQSDLDILADWADAWQLKFNADKCKVLHLGNSHHKATYKMRKHGSEEKIDLQETTLEKDLGVHMDPELKLSQHLERQVNKANRLLGLIRRSFVYLDCDTTVCSFGSTHSTFDRIWSSEIVCGHLILKRIRS